MHCNQGIYLIALAAEFKCLRHDQERQLDSDPESQMPAKPPQLLPLPVLDQIQKATDAAFSMSTKTCKIHRLENFSQKKERQRNELCFTEG